MERFVSISEVSKFLDVKESTLYVWRYKGMIPCYKVGGRVLFRLSELNKFAESFKQPVLARPAVRIAG